MAAIREPQSRLPSWNGPLGRGEPRMRLDRWQDKGRYGSLWVFPRAITSSVRRPADREEDHNIKSECRSRTVVRPAYFKQIETCNAGQTAGLSEHAYHTSFNKMQSLVYCSTIRSYLSCASRVQRLRKRRAEVRPDRVALGLTHTSRGFGKNYKS